MEPPDPVAVLRRIPALGDALRAALHRAVVGQDAVIDALVTALLCQGHVLMVGVPGLAKTLLVRQLAKATGLHFHRVQFTPDMMPADILGSEILQHDPDTHERSLRFLRGPIFTQLLLADEINRTPPKTQAALLEAMAERQVSVAGRSIALDAPFIVVATQNPIEQEGTYPLPEAQLDRFLFMLQLTYPDREQERRLARAAAALHAAADEPTEPVVSRDELLTMHRVVTQMPVSEHVADAAVALVRRTRPTDPQAPPDVRRWVAWGAGPRATQALLLAAAARAALLGRPTPGSDDVAAVAADVLRHRLVLSYHAAAQGVTADRLLASLMT